MALRDIAVDLYDLESLLEFNDSMILPVSFKLFICHSSQ